MGHAEREHALLSASSAKRWLACTPSARLEDTFPRKDTAFSLEGTMAHEIAESELRRTINGEKPEGNWTTNDHAYDTVCAEVQPYVDSVIETINTYRASCDVVVPFLETKLDFSEWVPEGFGTGDATIIADDTIHIIDLKFGKGVKVDATNNPQLRLYALGAYMAFKDVFDLTKVVMEINQPRLDQISREEMTIDELLAWGESIKPTAKLAFEGLGEFNPGEHCRFCKAKGTCRALAEQAMNTALEEFKDIELLNEEEVGQALQKLNAVEIWIKAIKDYATNQLLQGSSIPGWKLVEGRSLRKYVDELKVASALNSAGYEDALIYEKKLLGITAMEKAIGKKNFSSILADLVIKPQGAPTLAPESDKRPAIENVQELFKDIKVEEGDE